MQVSANGLRIEVDDQGPPDGEPLLLVMGLGMQLVAWPDDWVRMLVARGFRVIRFDNRDIGLSQHFDHLGVPNLPAIALRHALGLSIRAPYRLSEMAEDARGVLDALGIAQAHVCGASMGGMIAQHLAVRHPARVKSLTLIMTSAGARHLPQPSLKVRSALLKRPRGNDLAAVTQHIESLLGVIGSPAYRPDPAQARARIESMVRRSWHPAGTARQMVAIVADGDRTPLLSRIAAPTRVVHGVADPLVPVAAGHDLVQRITGAVGDFIDGMGHDLPVPLFERLAQAVHDNARRAAAV